jgi:hypothetical protein
VPHDHVLVLLAVVGHGSMYLVEILFVDGENIANRLRRPDKTRGQCNQQQNACNQSQQRLSFD